MGVFDQFSSAMAEAERGTGVAPETRDPDARWLAAVMHTAFFLLLGGALARFLLRHPGEARTPWIIALSVVLAALYVLGPALGPGLGACATPRRLTWLALVVAVWMVLVVLAPSFAWCAVPLFYTGLRTLPARAALVLIGVLTVFVVGAQLRLAGTSTRTCCSRRRPSRPWRPPSSSTWSARRNASAP